MQQIHDWWLWFLSIRSTYSIHVKFAISIWTFTVKKFYLLAILFFIVIEFLDLKHLRSWRVEFFCHGNVWSVYTHICEVVNHIFTYSIDNVSCIHAKNKPKYELSALVVSVETFFTAVIMCFVIKNCRLCMVLVCSRCNCPAKFTCLPRASIRNVEDKKDL